MESTTNDPSKSTEQSENNEENNSNELPSNVDSTITQTSTVAEEVAQAQATTTIKTPRNEQHHQTPIVNYSKQSKHKHIKKRAILLHPPHIETISDDISSTTDDIKRLKHIQVRSNSTGKLYQSSRRVSFPENDSELVTGYLEPADPWACGK